MSYKKNIGGWWEDFTGQVQDALGTGEKPDSSPGGVAPNGNYVTPDTPTSSGGIPLVLLAGIALIMILIFKKK